MVSRIEEIAKAVVVDINAATLSESVTAERAYLVDYKLEDLKSVKCPVVAGKGPTTSPEGRNIFRRDFGLMVGVLRRTAGEAPGDVDPWVELTEEIADFLLGRKLSPVAATCVEYEIDPIYDADKLREEGKFASVISLVFRMVD